VRLTIPSQDDVEQVRIWRNAEPQFLRTPYLLTAEMQEKFYYNVICKRDSHHRYYSLIERDAEGQEQLFGFGGLTSIEWENSRGEISLIMRPEVRGKGYGAMAVDHLLIEAFLTLNLHTVDGEVYDCGNRAFWEKVVMAYGGYMTDLVGRKYWDGRYWGSMWFAITRREGMWSV